MSKQQTFQNKQSSINIHWVPNIRSLLFFVIFQPKKMSTRMNLSSINLVQRTHFSCNFHQLSLSQSRDMAKICYLGVPSYQAHHRYSKKLRNFEQHIKQIYLKYMSDNICLEVAPDWQTQVQPFGNWSNLSKLTPTGITLQLGCDKSMSFHMVAISCAMQAFDCPQHKSQ